MKKQKQETDAGSSPQNELSIWEEEMHALADVLCIEKRPTSSREEDPFTEYMTEVQGKFHKDKIHFGSRLAKGYQALLEQLASEGSAHS